MALSLVSVNIEWDRHLDTVLPFLKEKRADVICVQELLEQDIALFEEACGPIVVFSPMGYLQRGTLFAFGCAIFSRFPFSGAGEKYYVGTRDSIRINSEIDDCGTHSLVHADITKDGVAHRIATTHFTWTKNGESTPDQLANLAVLLKELDSLDEFVMAGDFNAPRGRDTFSALARRYTDNIPAHYETSLDPVLHTKAGRPLPYMVDGLFTTPGYRANDVSLQFGVSDHAAIVASIEIAAK